MKSTNVMLVMGYLSNDPKPLGKTGKVAVYSLSVPAGEGKWDVIPLKCFGKEAQRAMFLKSGNLVAVVAHTTKSSYEKADGTKQSTVDHIVDKQFTDLPGFQKIPYGFKLLAGAIEGLLTTENDDY